MSLKRGEDWGRRLSENGEGAEQSAATEGTTQSGASAAQLVSSDAELRAAVEPALRAGLEPAPVRLAGGDIAKALGVFAPAAGAGPAAGQPARAEHIARIDALRVDVHPEAHSTGPSIGPTTADQSGENLAGEPDVFFGCAHIVAAARRWGRVRPARPKSRFAQPAWLRGDLAVATSGEWLGNWKAAPAAHPADGRIHLLEAGRSFSRSQRLAARRRLSVGAHLPHPELRYRRLTQVELSFASALGLWIDDEFVGAAQHIEVKILPACVKVIF